MKILAWTNDWARPSCDGKFGGIGWYRIINPLEKIGADVERGEFRIGKGDDALKMKERGDIWVMKQMGNVEAMILVQTNAKFTGAKLVLDLDDDPFTVDKNHPQYDYHKEHEEMSRVQIEQADHIIVSTEPLKKVVQKYNKKVTVIPNAIDISIWDSLTSDVRTDGRIRLGWIGSASHLADRKVVQKAIAIIQKKYDNVDFYHAGMCITDQENKREFSFKGTKGYEEYPQFLNDLDLDIAIAPIKDTAFNRSKSNIKWLEHGMLGTPMVLSDVRPYSDSVEHGVTGFLAKTQKDWVEYLSKLIESKTLRKVIGNNANTVIRDNWDIKQQLPKYEELFEELTPKNITVYTAITGKYDKLSTRKIKGANQVAFTDQKSEIWDTKKPYDKFKDGARNSKIQKIMPHLFLDTEYSIYIDGNIELRYPPEKLIKEVLGEKDIAVFRHIGRDSIYDEAVAIAGLKKETVPALTEQLKAYSKRGIKEHAGLCECGVIIRRHTTRINDLNEKWWAEYCRFSKRDQMSFPVAFPLEEVKQMEGSVHKSGYFKIINHK